MSAPAPASCVAAKRTPQPQPQSQWKEGQVTTIGSLAPETLVSIFEYALKPSTKNVGGKYPAGTWKTLVRLSRVCKSWRATLKLLRRLTLSILKPDIERSSRNYRKIKSLDVLSTANLLHPLAVEEVCFNPAAGHLFFGFTDMTVLYGQFQNVVRACLPRFAAPGHVNRVLLPKAKALYLGGFTRKLTNNAGGARVSASDALKAMRGLDELCLSGIREINMCGDRPAAGPDDAAPCNTVTWSDPAEHAVTTFNGTEFLQTGWFESTSTENARSPLYWRLDSVFMNFERLQALDLFDLPNLVQVYVGHVKIVRIVDCNSLKAVVGVGQHFCCHGCPSLEQIMSDREKHWKCVTFNVEKCKKLVCLPVPIPGKSLDEIAAYRLSRLPKLRKSTRQALIKNLPRVLARAARVVAAGIPFSVEEAFELGKISSGRHSGSFHIRDFNFKYK